MGKLSEDTTSGRGPDLMDHPIKEIRGWSLGVKYEVKNVNRFT